MGKTCISGAERTKKWRENKSKKDDEFKQKESLKHVTHVTSHRWHDPFHWVERVWVNTKCYIIVILLINFHITLSIPTCFMHIDSFQTCHVTWRHTHDVLSRVWRFFTSSFMNPHYKWLGFDCFIWIVGED